ncbi:MAG: selenocysteine-specific translation elongation factor [Verrucomicrobia bacterium]|nr:selenocysteine-specific translation elongation factor [Verrucomicrobiota bacterium]
METRRCVIATAGHVNHGKSALARALTGMDPDRLPDEKARGLTIDLGFAHLELEDPAAGTRWLADVVDAPGREQFVKNMVGDVGAADLALLAVAADEGWMPQTEERLQILACLGVRRGVVALTKIDLVPEKREEREREIRKRLAGTPWAEAPIAPVSAVTGEGLDALLEALRQTLRSTPAAEDIGKPRLAVDRVFTVKGAGSVVAGALIGGALRRGQTVVVQPFGGRSRIHAIRQYHRETEIALPGARTALNLPDLEPKAPDQPRGLARGQIVTLPGLGEPSDTADALVRAAGRPGAGAPAIKSGAVVRVHHGTGSYPGRIALRDREELLPGEEALAEIRLGRPAFWFAGDRIVIRDSSQRHTLGCGLILEPGADRRRWRTEAQAAFLKRRAAAPQDPRAFAASLTARDGAARIGLALRASRFSEKAVRQAFEELAAAGEAVMRGELALDPALWRELQGEAIRAIDEEHRRHPKRPGLDLAKLRSRLKARLSAPGLFEALVEELCRSKEFVLRANVIRRAAHKLALPPKLAPLGERIRAELAAHPFDPPSRKRLAPDPDSFQALRYLLSAGEAVAVGPETVLSAEAYREAARRICAFLRRRGQATVSELRRELGAPRRVAAPLLEKLDKEGITRREGNLRRLGPAAPPEEASAGA